MAELFGFSFKKKEVEKGACPLLSNLQARIDAFLLVILQEVTMVNILI